MTYTSLTTALTLYRGRTLDLEQAATYGGVPTNKFVSELRARGIQIRETDHTARAAN